MKHLGDFPVNGKVALLWNTNDQTGASITRSTDGTLKIFKAHATAATWATERSSLAGVTQLEDFDATGMHSVYIDLSDNTDAGFYAAGNEYQVAIVGAVVDTKTVNAVLASFSIERAGLSAQAKLDVNAEVDTAIADARLDEILAADSDIDGAAPPTVGSVVHEMLSKTAGSFTYDQTTDSLEAIRDKEADIETDTAEIGVAGAGLTAINLPNQTMDIVGNITGNLSGSVGSVTAAVSISSGIKKNATLIGFEFLMTDSTNHNPVTGKTVTVTRSIDDGAFAAGTLSAVTEIAFGIYAVDFGAGDLNGRVITLRATAAGCDDLFVTIVPDP